MKASQSSIYSWVLIDEGGFTNDPDDNGGVTSWGITIDEVKKWRNSAVSIADMGRFTQDEAKLIFTSWYWTPLHCDDLPAGVDYAVFDAGLLHGIHRATRWLQLACKVDSDGKLGPNTLLAAVKENPISTINNMQIFRRRRIKSHPDRKKFGAGWTNRITRVTNRAVSLVKNV
jgi:lysozyme family protein